MSLLTRQSRPARSSDFPIGPAILFIAEPLFLHRWMEQRHAAAPGKYFRRLQIMHWVLLVLALVTVCGAVEGAHGGL